MSPSDASTAGSAVLFTGAETALKGADSEEVSVPAVAALALEGADGDALTVDAPSDPSGTP